MITVDIYKSQPLIDETGSAVYENMDVAVADNNYTNLSKDQYAGNRVEDGFCFVLLDTRVRITPLLDSEGNQRKISCGRNVGKPILLSEYIVKPIGKLYNENDRVLISTRLFEQMAYEYNFAGIAEGTKGRRGALVRGTGDVIKLYNRTLNKTKAIQSVIDKQNEGTYAIKVTYTEVKSCAFNDPKTPEIAFIANLNFVSIEKAKESEV